ncbi:hypothetical protein HPP92_024468 [Vanilla planifolia]|uniref:Trichome birefringence-like N-terminal domain-containing protein n=1 Tax=Vanilla planifolia TaxID=51239 RepID=A0A835PMF6_VANPL|nr:hypothetical protein HPP92_024468 [Vanilla planifolia]
MKGLCLIKLKGAKLSICLIALVCATLLICSWEKTSHLTTFLLPSEHFAVQTLSPETPLYYADFVNHQQPTAVVLSNRSSHGGPINLGLHQVTEKVEPQIASDLVNEGAKLECNYAKGKWVADKRRPLYSGFGCKQWLSPMWACRLMQRTDFSFENYRWQPENCEMPNFRGSAFLRKMQHKTLAFIGDSLGRQQFQSLMCMITAGRQTPEIEDVGKSYGLIKAHSAKRPNGWAYRFPKTNTTVLYYWSASLCYLEPLNQADPASRYAMHLDRPAFFLKRFVGQFDVVVLNTGHHWNRGKLLANRWDMYVDGKPIADRKLAQIANAKNYTVYSVVKWLDSQLPLHPGLKAFYRSISPRHFVNGDWNTGGSCDNMTPLAAGGKVTQDHSSDRVAEGATMGTKVKLLDITASSQLRDESHISKYSIKASAGVHDCLHWCLPGVPDAWNELLYAQI